MRVKAILTIATVFVAVPQAAPAGPAACGWSGYSHVGVADDRPAAAAEATITATRAPTVQAGHVAAWLGFGGYGAGRNGTDAWIQAGVIAYPGNELLLYVEFAAPLGDPVLTVLGPARVGRSYRVAVGEVPGRPSWWQASVDGRRVRAPVRLAGSHGRWAATAVGESWDGDAPVCNRFGFRFAGVRVAANPVWRPLTLRAPLRAPGYGFQRKGASFVVGNVP